MSTSASVLSPEDRHALRRAIPARAGEEIVIERMENGYTARIEVELNDRPVIATIYVEGYWDDWDLDSVCYT